MMSGEAGEASAYFDLFNRCYIRPLIAQKYLFMAMQLKNLFANTDHVSIFMSYLPEGEYLFHQGDDF